MDIIGVYNYYKNPESLNKVHPAKAGLNTVMGAYGLTGAGTIPALLYLVLTLFIRVVGRLWNDYQSIQSDNSAIMPGFITAPMVHKILNYECHKIYYYFFINI
ncbi:hypothetical protein EJ377_13080 (plasmid) [Chryseobacterium arthrosphaerae]|uniref:Uncharacterized protein n=1 Tax=Chryseobacterium arthrosphaerae TaxID=651561 RepID=A0A432DXR0_9FLAO|nr:hypothetical protein EJ377_13080 [Chryseobacterium arthrosphaerae]